MLSLPSCLGLTLDVADRAVPGLFFISNPARAAFAGFGMINPAGAGAGFSH